MLPGLAIFFVLAATPGGSAYGLLLDAVFVDDIVPLLQVRTTPSRGVESAVFVVVVDGQHHVVGRVLRRPLWSRLTRGGGWPTRSDPIVIDELVVDDALQTCSAPISPPTFRALDALWRRETARPPKSHDGGRDGTTIELVVAGAAPRQLWSPDREFHDGRVVAVGEALMDFACVDGSADDAVILAAIARVAP